MVWEFKVMTLDYLFPHSIDECVSILSRNNGDIKILAGGTDVFLRIRNGKEPNRILLDISGIGLNNVHIENGNYIIGSMANLTFIEKYFNYEGQPVHLISEAVNHIASWQTRNLATIGGNICTGNSCADLAPVLLVLDAHLKITSKKKTRKVPIQQFFLEPRRTCIQKDELLTEIVIKKDWEEGYRSAFLKIGKRKEHFIAIMNIAVIAKIRSDLFVEDFKVAVGTLAPTPIRLFRTENVFIGNKIDEKLLEKACCTMLTEIKPRSSLRSSKEYRLAVAPELLRKSIRTCINNQGSGL